MKERYHRLLDLTFELEGLLLLAMGREETNPRLNESIKRKIRDIALVSGVAPAREKAIERDSLPSAGNRTVNEVARPVVETEKPRVREDRPAAVQEQVRPVSDKKYQPQNQKSEATEVFSAYYNLEDDDEPVVEVRRKENRKPDSRRGRPVFSLNDRYYYIREVFGADASAFDMAIERISRLGNYEEAQEYLMEEYDLNPDEVDSDASFLSVIETYFKNRR